MHCFLSKFVIMNSKLFLDKSLVSMTYHFSIRGTTQVHGQLERRTRQSAETSHCLKTPSVEKRLQQTTILPKTLSSKWNSKQTVIQKCYLIIHSDNAPANVLLKGHLKQITISEYLANLFNDLQFRNLNKPFYPKHKEYIH